MEKLTKAELVVLPERGARAGKWANWTEDELTPPPDTIYLQMTDLNGDPVGEITWCADRINDDDVVYVKKATVEARVAAAELMAAALEADRRSGIVFAELELGYINVYPDGVIERYRELTAVMKRHALKAWNEVSNE